MRTKVNGCATLDDFRRMREFEPTEKVLLPKLGKEVLLRRPTALWFMLHDKVPLSLSSKAVADGDQPAAATMNVQDVQEAAKWLKEVLEQTMVEPKCTDELLDLMDFEDALFISRWAHGEVLSKEGKEAHSLETFRTERELPSSRPNG